jgi:hypothetical protein
LTLKRLIIVIFGTIKQFASSIISCGRVSSIYPDYAQRFTSAELAEMLYWHTLSEAWSSMDYEIFLVDRRKRIAQVIKDGSSRLS